MSKKFLTAEEMMANIKPVDKVVEAVVEEKELIEETFEKIPVKEEFRVDGTVFVGSIQRRGKTKKRGGTSEKVSNVVKPIGYKITELATGREIYMEKMEAIDLVARRGVVNATIRPREHKNYDKTTGALISTEINLNLHPKKGERPFTESSRLFPVFQLDDEGKIVKPAELVISEDQCTETLWEVIKEASKNRKPGTNSKTYRRIDEEEKRRRIKAAFDAVKFTNKGKNPFDMN